MLDVFQFVFVGFALFDTVDLPGISDFWIPDGGIWVIGVSADFVVGLGTRSQLSDEKLEDVRRKVI